MTDTGVISPLAVPAAGLLAWGQSGVYNAVDDRLVIAGLFASGRGRGGLVVPPTLTPGAAGGLSVDIGPWQAVVDCGDGTKAVIGTRGVTSIDETATGASARADVLWADISPDLATYQVSLIAESAMVGRAGVFLGLILAPASASTSAAMDLRPGNARVLGQSGYTPSGSATGTTPATMASLVIPAYDAEVNAVYEIKVWMYGQQSTGKATVNLQPKIGAVNLNTNLVLGTTAFTGGTVSFRIVATYRLRCLSVGTTGTFESELEILECEQNSNLAPANGNVCCGAHCDWTPGSYVVNTTRDNTMALAASFGSSSGGPLLNSKGALRGRVA